MINQSIGRSLDKALKAQDRRELDEIADILAAASLTALSHVESKLAQAGVTHKIPLFVGREELEDALPKEEARGHSSVGARLVRLQLQLLDEERAKPAGTSLDFEIFRNILAQHNIKF